MSAHPSNENGGGFHRLEYDGADGAGNDHDGRDVRDVNIFRVVFVGVVAIVPGTRQAVRSCRQRIGTD